MPLRAFVISGISDPVETLVQGPGGPPRWTLTFECSLRILWDTLFISSTRCSSSWSCSSGHQAFGSCAQGFGSEAGHVGAGFQVGGFFRLGLLFRMDKQRIGIHVMSSSGFGAEAQQVGGTRLSGFCSEAHQVGAAFQVGAFPQVGAVLQDEAAHQDSGWRVFSLELAVGLALLRRSDTHFSTLQKRGSGFQLLP